MKISDILKQEKVTLSLEVFPPKTSEKYESTAAAAKKIAALHPDFMSVTYGAGGGTGTYTAGIAEEIQKEHGVTTLAHLTCVSSSRETVKQQIEAMKAAGIKNIMALRGDLTPELENTDRSKWDYQYAVQLIRELKESSDDFCIGAACYPELHPESINQKEDILHLKEKVDAGADFLTTQMVFDNNLFFNFMYKLREAGVTVPVIPGIMPITNAKQLGRSVALSGTSVPTRFREIVDKSINQTLSRSIMTSLTTMLAILPFLHRGDMGSALQYPLSLTIIVGMGIGTMVSLFMIPLFYYLIYKNRKV